MIHFGYVEQYAYFSFFASLYIWVEFIATSLTMLDKSHIVQGTIRGLEIPHFESLLILFKSIQILICFSSGFFFTAIACFVSLFNHLVFIRYTEKHIQKYTDVLLDEKEEISPHIN